MTKATVWRCVLAACFLFWGVVAGLIWGVM